MADIEIEIDGRKLTASPTQNIIHVADDAGIYIPRFCYHKNLSIPANCRMCLVEVEKAPKVLPACVTPCTPGMKVFTRSPKTLAAQRAVMEFLLINHPLDCPICDQGGECELQDLSMGYGQSGSQYDEPKRSVADQDLGPLIDTEMTRCIHCTRCVRFGEEVAGIKELGAIGRSEFTEIGTYIQHCMRSEVSGNIIDLCPVGALTSKPFRFRARAWELDQTPSVSPHDCIGTNVNVHTRYGKVMRVVARENQTINRTWITDRDRFAYTGLYHPDRLKEPRVRSNGEWQVVDWQTALEAAASGLKEVIAVHGADKLGALASPNSTLEEFYLLQKIVRALDSPHIDHRLREMDTSDQTKLAPFPGLEIELTSIADCDAILLVGANIQKEQPILALNVRQASLKGAPILAINPIDHPFNFHVNAKQIVAPHKLTTALTELKDALSKPTHKHTLAHYLHEKKNIAILLGAYSMHHPNASEIRTLAKEIAAVSGAKIGFLTDGANSAGGYLAGAVPHQHANGMQVEPPGLNAYDMLAKPRSAYLLLNIEPEFDVANAHQARHSLQQAKFVVALSLYRNPILEAEADVILPMAAFTETAGTYVNVCGEWQSVVGNAEAFAGSRPAWKILRVLGNFLQLEGFDYESAEEIKHEVKALAASAQYVSKSKVEGTARKFNPNLSRIGEVPLYAIDSLVRRAEPLQAAQKIMEGELACVKLHPTTAKKLNVQQDETVRVKQHRALAQLVVVLDERIAEGAAWVAGGILPTSHLGDLIGEIDIEKL